MDVLKQVLQFLYFVGLVTAAFGAPVVFIEPGAILNVAVLALPLIAPYKLYQYQKRRSRSATVEGAEA
jgi:hypothetical protein